VSTRIQNHKGNLQDQENSHRAIVEVWEASVVGVVKYTGSGQDPSRWHWKAVELAKPQNAKLLAETINRFVRHP
jgi:hypothetical protein